MENRLMNLVQEVETLIQTGTEPELVGRVIVAIGKKSEEKRQESPEPMSDTESGADLSDYNVDP